MLYRTTWVFALLALLGIGMEVVLWGKPDSKSRPAEPVSFDQVKHLFEKYCYGCHGETKQKGDLSLQAFQKEADALKARPIWEKVRHNVQTREMPPENKPQPSLEERDLIARWIDAKVLQSDCANPDPGRVTIRRLNRVEYNNTIRDLVGVSFQPAADFPADDTGYGFDNIGDVLSLPPVLLEKYMVAAEKVLNAAIISSPSTNGASVKFLAGRLPCTCQGQPTDRGNAFHLGREGQVWTNLHFPKDGTYIFRARAYGELAGGELPKMQLRVDKKALKTFEIGVEEDNPKIYEVQFKARAGEQEIAAAYLNNFRKDEGYPDPRRDRNLIVEYLEIIGPAGPQVYPESHKRIFISKPAGPADEKRVAREIVSHFAERAYRRPVTSKEVDRLLRFYEMARGEGENFESGVKLSLQAVLVSPHFLFRGELQPEPNNPNKTYPVDEFALASRLSYFLWSSMPDDELFAHAQGGTLRKNLDSQVKRMLRDPKAEAFVQNFVGQWLQLRNLQLVAPDPTEFPDFDEELRAAMQKETELLFANVMKQDRSLCELLDADYTFLNERLARHYKIEKVKGDVFQKVRLRSNERGGILTHASVLTLTSNPTRTSPVKRGKWVLENILGTPPPPPPPEVPDLKEDKKALTGTLRQRMEQHRANPNCASCHARMDPIGFSLENFDGIGAWRNKDGQLPIDPSGQLVTGESFKGPAELKKILSEKKKNEFAHCITEKMLTYALGRGLEYYDKCAVEKIFQELAKDDYTFSRLIFGIVNSTPFQMRRGEGERLAQGD